MKDRNGKTLRKGDVCVVCYSPKSPEDILSDFEGEVCEVLGVCFVPEALKCQIFSATEHRILFESEIEIIGDVR